MSYDRLYIDLLAFSAESLPAGRLEARMKKFLEAESSTESLDGVAFSQINGSDTKADYLLGKRGLVAELKSINGNPHARLEMRLKERLGKENGLAPYGTINLSKVTEGLHDRDELNKMLADVAARAVRRSLQKADEQIASIKKRLNLHNAGGLVILMNDAEPMIDVSAIGFAIKSAFETVEDGYPNITNVWVSVECHKIQMPGDRIGYPQLHIFKSLERGAELDFMARMLIAWGRNNGSRLERIKHEGKWDTMLPIYDGSKPILSPFQ